MNIVSKLRASDVDGTDFYCGAGGTTEGAVAAGVRMVQASNHWKLAVQTHWTNHPDTDHICADLSQINPRFFKRTTFGYFSPECTNHSKAKTRPVGDREQQALFSHQEETERSRATMHDVVRFAEYHKYDIIIVENVVEVLKWKPFRGWLQQLTDLEYEHKFCFLNSQFFPPTPQSRDRIYMVFWKKGNKAPDLEFRPKAPCFGCGKVVESVQTWKPGTTSYMYGTKRAYIYTCPECRAEVRPFYFAAANAIDWSLPITKIKDREKELFPKTLARIRKGLERYKDHKMLIRVTQAGDDSRAYPVIGPFPTQTTRQDIAFAVPGTVTADTVVPEAFLAELYGTSVARSMREAMGALTAGGVNHAVVVPMPFLPQFYGGMVGRQISETFGAVTAVDHHGLVAPEAFLASYYGGSHCSTPLSAPMGTATCGDRHGLIVPEPFITTYYGGERGDDRNRPVAEELATIPTANRHGLVTPDADVQLEECGFRMLAPHEVKMGMGFRKDYVILGNNRQQVRQAGNAVTPPLMTQLTERCIASLS